MAYLQKTVNQKTVICSIDIGNSTSSVSFLYAEGKDVFRDLKTKIYRVDTWPQHSSKSLQIPSRLCYQNQKPVRFGENARRPNSKREKWTLVEGFKRHVNSIESNDVSDAERGDFDPFPAGVTLRQIYQDWVKFLFDAGAAAFRASSKGSSVDDVLWKKRLCVFVVPNGWSEPEHAHLKTILHNAGCVTDCANVRFARESEADLHYGLFLGQEKLTQQANLSFFVCNVGNSTGDLGFYKVTSTNPLLIEEVKPAQSFPVGRIVEEDTIGDEAGPDADDDDDENLDPVYNVIKYVNRLSQGTSGSDVPKYIVLTGGCGRDKRSRDRIANGLSSANIGVLTLLDANGLPLSPTSPGNPTVDGGLFSCIYNFIRARKSVYHFGCVRSVLYDKNLKEHRRRRELGLNYINGHAYVPYAWEKIVSLGELVRDGATRQKTLTRVFRDRPSGVHPVDVVLYASKEPNPQWVFESHGKAFVPGVRELCKITADINVDEMSLEEKTFGDNQKSYSAHFTVDIDFASVTSTAVVSWKKANGTTGSKAASFSPPSDTNSDWESNDHQGDKSAEQEQQVDNEETKPPKNPREDKDNKPEQQQPAEKNGRAVLDTGIYTISNPGSIPPNELGQAYWVRNQKDLRCHERTRKDTEKWYIDSDSINNSFKIEPNFDGVEPWRLAGSPSVGHSAAPYDGDQVLAWQLIGSGPAKRWYATRALGDFAGKYRYYILSTSGNYAWSVTTQPAAGSDFLTVQLRQWDKLDHHQVWEIVPMS